MLDRGEGSTQASGSDSESMEVPGEETPPSLEDKEEKIEVPEAGGGKRRKGASKSPEVEKEKPKPRASVLEYKSVSQMYVLRVFLLPLLPLLPLFSLFSQFSLFPASLALSALFCSLCSFCFPLFPHSFASKLCTCHTRIAAYRSSSWDKDTYGRKLVDSLEDSSKKKDKYEEYIFVVRRQYGVPFCSIYIRDRC